MFGLLRNRRRRRVLARASIPEALWAATVASTPALARLDGDARRRLRELALLFLHEKRIEAAGGLPLDEGMKVHIAALACLPILELGIDCYDGFVSVIIYPDEFLVRNREHEDEDGVVHSGDDILSGEAWEQGPVILAWREVEASGLGEGFNVVAHEFAHKLDLLDGAFDGMPPLHATMRAADWIEAFQTAYDDLRARLDRGEETWLDPYAAEEPAEFFAVCTEMFFDVPEELRVEYPALYAQLRAFFKQDPAGVD
jgi:Mlc titration factor MtfA (ptsG expression regulator)